MIFFILFNLKIQRGYVNLLGVGKDIWPPAGGFFLPLENDYLPPDVNSGTSLMADSFQVIIIVFPIISNRHNFQGINMGSVMIDIAYLKTLVHWNLCIK